MRLHLAIAALLSGVLVDVPLAYAESDNPDYSAQAATCVVDKKINVAFQFLETMPQDRTDKDKRRISDILSRCVSESGMYFGVFGDQTLAFEIAKIIMVRNYGSANLDFSQAPPLKRPEVAKPFGPLLVRSAEEREQSARRSATLMTFGECVVRGSYAHAHALLLSAPYSDEESRQARDLQGSFDLCLGTSPIDTEHSDVRGAMALAYVRMARAIERSAR